MRMKSVQNEQNAGEKVKVWTFDEGQRLYLAKNKENPLVKAAELERKGDYKGAIEIVGIVLGQHPTSSYLAHHLAELLRRKQIIEQ